MQLQKHLEILFGPMWTVAIHYMYYIPFSEEKDAQKELANA